MAEKLQDYDFKARGTNKYPWEEWTDGDIWKIKQGEDFPVKIGSMRSILKIHATRHGFTLKTGSPEDGVLVFQFVPKDNK